MAGGQADREQARPAGRHLGRQHLGGAGWGLDRLDPEVLQHHFGGRVPDLAERLGRDRLGGAARQQVLDAGRHQLPQHRRAQPLAHEAALALLPVAGAEAAQPAPQGQGQLLHPGQPFLGQFVPHPPQRRVLQGVGGQAAVALGVLGEQGRIHQAQEPGPVHLHRPQAVEQLLALIHLRGRQAAGQLALAAGGRGGQLAAAQPPPADRRPHDRRQHQGDQHRPEAPFGLLLPFFVAPPHAIDHGHGGRRRRDGGGRAQRQLGLRPRRRGRRGGADRPAALTGGLGRPPHRRRLGCRSWGWGRRRRRGGLGHQHHRAVGPGNRARAVGHRQRLEGHQGLAGGREALLGVAAEQALQQALQVRLVLQGCRPAPLHRRRIKQALRPIPAQQHQGHHPQGVQIHPGLGRFAPGQLRRGIARGGPQQPLPGGATGGAPHQAEIEGHRQAVAVAAQQVGGTEVPVQQVLAVQGGEHRQQLAQQQQHLPRPEHQLALRPQLQQLLVGAARLPLPHQPELILGLDHGTDAGHLGVEHPLQPRPQLPGPGLVLLRPDAAQGHRRIGGQLVTRLPQLPLGPARLRP